MYSTGRSIRWTVFLLLLITVANATSLTLSQLQRISGFSSICAEAYNTPLTQCTLDELTSHAPGRACSIECVEQLERVSVSINTQCKGTRAYPDTLIGMFFNQTAVTTLCPNVLSGGSGENNGGKSSQSATASSVSETVIRTTTQTSLTQASTTTQRSTQAIASTTVVSISSSSSASPTSSSLVTSQTQVAEPTLNSAATLTQSQLSIAGSNTAKAASSLTSSSATSSASSSQDTDGNRGGSGGTPFDISASSRNVARMSWVFPTLMCLLGAVWFV